MDPSFHFDSYLLKRQFFALTGKLRLYNPQGMLVLYVEQKLLKFKEDIRVYGDEAKTREILLIKARTIIDFYAAYDVIDPAEGRKVGALRRKGLKSMVRDEWDVLDENDRPIGRLWEDSIGRALLRLMIFGALLPQDYDMAVGDTRVAVCKQRFNPFVYQMDIDFGMDTGRRLDRRLGTAAAMLLAVIEGRQN
ncbi:MAG: hypothetical protein JW765_06100 [Deltaproteobacteria bacterium]|nr:hypothetical protein [Candidatus Zymogenaceae bacterium]